MNPLFAAILPRALALPHCECGAMLTQLESGGCGGMGSIHGCEQCGAVYRQTTGGIVGTLGGERMRKIDGATIADYRKNQDGKTEDAT